MKSQLSNRIIRIAAICWLLIHFLALAHFYSFGISLRTNIFDLLTTHGNSTAQLHRAATLLKQQAATLRFTIIGESEELSLRAAKLLALNLAEINEVSLTSLPSQTAIAQSAMQYLAQGRAGLLTPKQLLLFAPSSPPQKLIDTISQKLYSPFAAFYSEFLSLDPLLLLPENILESKLNGEIEIKHGFLRKQHTDNRVAFTILAKTTKQSLTIDDQTKLVNKLNAIVSTTNSQVPGTEVRWSAMLAFAQSSAQRMESDIKLVSTIGALFTIALLFFAFRSASAVALSMASVLSGVLIGTYFVVLVQGNIHLLTIGFGSSLMGACIDYSLHFFSEYFYAQPLGRKTDATRARKNVVVPIVLGTITSILAFAALLFSDFSGLRELALFSIGSLFATCTTVLLCLPLVLKMGETRRPPRVLTSLLDKFAVISRGNKSSRIIVLITLVALLIPGLCAVTTNDDIRSVQSPEPRLIQNEKWIADVSGLRSPSSYLFIEAKTEDEVSKFAYQAESLLSTAVSENLIESFVSIYGLIPPKETQEQTAFLYQQYLQTHALAISNGLRDLGYEQSIIDNVFKQTNATRNASELLNILPLATGSEIYRDDKGYWTAIAIHGVRDHILFQQLISASPQLQYYQATDEISKQFYAYRMQSTSLVTAAYTLIFAILLFRYGAKKGLFAFIPLLGSTIIVLATLGYLQQPVSFFSIIAMVIVIGLGIDFYIFLLEDAQHSIAVKSSVVLSAFSTITTFALLALSDTAVLKTIGLVISIGVSSAMLLALFVISTTKTYKNNAD